MNFDGVVRGYRLTEAKNQEREPVTVIELKILVPYSAESHEQLGRLYQSTVSGTIEAKQVCLGFE